MNPPDSEETIFSSALQLESVERASYLDQACGADVALRQRVESLLNVHKPAEHFLETAVSPTLLVTQTAFVPLAEKAGDKIGRYKLLQQIGEGGCGVVYMAEQEQPVRRRVALKVIKLGMDTKSVIARFEAERQALAMMDHPNIAKVLDAGATDAGRPYFVMELVRGIKITDYCDQNHLDTRTRLDLFVQICQAIQHAHQKGIIHRDIKPSNILVADHDGVPVPKVIDFGIAKATTDQRLTDKTLFTALEQFMGTPAYMSPEQARLSGLDIDTRTDIYSLGVLLYELLTGRTPFDAKELLAAGLDEMRRTICEKEPARPSTRLSTILDADLTTIAQLRQTDAPKLLHLLRGDLDWVVMKALEKDRTRRYETATGFAADVQRHLNNEPVVARPVSNFYRFQKLAHRNKLAFAAASAVTAALIIGLGVSTWLFLKEEKALLRAVVAEKGESQLRQEAETARANETILRQQAEVGRANETILRQQAETARATEAKLREQAEVGEKTQSQLRHEAETARLNEATLRQQAEADEKKAKTEASKSEQVAKFLKDMLQGVQPSVALGRDTTMLREILDKAAERVGKELSGQPEVEAELRHTIFHAYYELAEHAKAEAMVREWLAIKKRLHGYEHPEVAAALNDLATILDAQDKLVEAEAIQREALALRKKLLGDEHLDVADSLSSLATLRLRKGKLAEAEAMLREALAMQEKLLGNGHPDVAYSLNKRAALLWKQGKLAEAEAMDREALAIRKELLGNEHPEVAQSLNNLAVVLQAQNKLVEAEAMHREALAMRRKLLGNEHPDVADSLNNLAGILSRQRKLAEAEAMQRVALAMQKKLLGDEHLDVALSLNNLALDFQAQGKLVEAEAMHREALAMRRKLLGNEHPDVADSLFSLAMMLWNQGKLAEAEALHREALAMRRKLLGNEHASVVESLHLLAELVARRGNLAGAEVLYLELWEIVPTPHPDEGGFLSKVASVDVFAPGFKRHILQEIVTLYKVWSKKDATKLRTAAEWKKKLAAFDRAEAAKKSPAAPKEKAK